MQVSNEIVLLAQHCKKTCIYILQEFYRNMSWKCIWSVNWRHNSWSLFSFHLMVSCIPSLFDRLELVLGCWCTTDTTRTGQLWSVITELKKGKYAVIMGRQAWILGNISPWFCSQLTHYCGNSSLSNDEQQLFCDRSLLRLTFYRVITPFSGTCTERLNTAGPALSWPGETVQLYSTAVQSAPAWAAAEQLSLLTILYSGDCTCSLWYYQWSWIMIKPPCV